MSSDLDLVGLFRDQVERWQREAAERERVYQDYVNNLGKSLGLHELASVICDAPLLGRRDARRAAAAASRSAKPRVPPRPARKLWTPKPFVFIRSRVVREGEDVPLDYIYQRDGAICHLCGKHVARKDATRDHLVPISAGGPHTRVNVALAHWTCNVRRGVGRRIPAQLRLLD